MNNAVTTVPAAPSMGAVPAVALSLIARRLLGVCRAHHGRVVGIPFIALRAGMNMNRCFAELHELNAAGLVCYISATAPLWAPATPWHPSCCYAGNNGWGVVCEVPEPGHFHRYHQRAAPGCYATQEQAQAAADTLNHTGAPRLRAADRYAMLPAPDDDYHPHPWEL
jgi:hypothetical protein